MQDPLGWLPEHDVRVRGLVSALLERILTELRAVEPATAEPFLGRLRSFPAVEAVLFYGSCLFERTRRPSSIPDFFVLTGSLAAYHRRPGHALLNKFLPPSVYHCRIPERTTDLEQGRPSSRGAGSESNRPSAAGESERTPSPQRCKYCVISLAQFARETSPAASDIHHLGRFSKRFAIVHSRGAETDRLLARGALSSILTLLPASLSRLPAVFSLEDLMLEQLALSYLGERRVCEPDKVLGLLEAGRPYYLAVYRQALELHSALHGSPRLSGTDHYAQPPPRPAIRRRAESFLWRSRVRGVLRWPKYVVTVDDWLDYILDKLERHQGVRVELTPMQRRYPLLFGWPIYWRLRRQGIVK